MNKQRAREKASNTTECLYLHSVFVCMQRFIRENYCYRLSLATNANSTPIVTQSFLLLTVRFVSPPFFAGSFCAIDISFLFVSICCSLSSLPCHFSFLFIFHALYRLSLFSLLPLLQSRYLLSKYPVNSKTHPFVLCAFWCILWEGYSWRHCHTLNVSFVNSTKCENIDFLSYCEGREEGFLVYR